VNEASVRQPEVRGLQPPVGVDEDVVRLDIPVYDSERMQVNERVCELECVDSSSLLVERPELLQEREQVTLQTYSLTKYKLFAPIIES
jgi:hypothetical protein